MTALIWDGKYNSSGKRVAPVKIALPFETAGIASGPLFRGILPGGKLRATGLTGDTVADIIKRRCKEAGFNPEEFGGHSLRAGFISTCAEHGDSERDIMEQSRQKSLLVFRGYI